MTHDPNASRRTFLKGSGLLAASTVLAPALRGTPAPAAHTPAATSAGNPAAAAPVTAAMTPAEAAMAAPLNPEQYNVPELIRPGDHWDTRREELIGILAREQYGAIPADPYQMESRSISLQDAFGGIGTAEDIDVIVTTARGSGNFQLLLCLPKYRRPKAVFIGLNFYGNHTTTHETVARLAECWLNSAEGPQVAKDNRAIEDGRGWRHQRWPLQYLIARGYGVATVCYNEFMPDHRDGLGNGLSALLSQSEGAISTWAWGLHRICDLVKERLPQPPVIAFGHSRLGKTSLWAAATYPRIDAVVTNQSGTGGAALARRINSERVGGSRWYTARLDRYSRKEQQMPFDQHFLLGAIAPRPLYVASAVEDISATPVSQYLSLYHAQPAYRLAGIPVALPAAVPAVTQPLAMGPLGTHVRPGYHGVTLYDWQCFADFFDRIYGS